MKISASFFDRLETNTPKTSRLERPTPYPKRSKAESKYPANSRVLKRITSLALSYVLAFGSLHHSFAAEPPTITISKSDTVAIAVSPIAGADGPAITKVVQNDLTISGYFSVTGASGAGLVVSGSSSGAALQGKVTDHSGKIALSSNYNGSARARAHAFANDIIRTLTGNPGIAGTKIAFVATKSGRKEIYTADYDGSNVQQCRPQP